MRDRTTIFLIGAAIILALLALAGCGKDAIRDQAASDAIAGVEAFPIIARAHGIAPEALAFMDALLPGVTDYILAARGVKAVTDLPPPRRTPAAIAADIPAYVDDGAKTKEEAASGTFWAILGGTVLTILGILRQTGLGGPIVQSIAGMASVVMERSATRQQRAAQVQVQGQLASIGQTLTQVIELAPPELSGPIKQLAKDALPPSTHVLIQEIVAPLKKPADPA
jgi:hypothetical protein